MSHGCHRTPKKASTQGSMLGGPRCPAGILNALWSQQLLGCGGMRVGLIGHAGPRGCRGRWDSLAHLSPVQDRGALNKLSLLILLSPFFGQGFLSLWKRITKKCSETCPHHNFSLGLASYTSYCCQTFLCNLSACPGPRLARQ